MSGCCHRHYWKCLTKLIMWISLRCVKSICKFSTSLEAKWGKINVNKQQTTLFVRNSISLHLLMFIVERVATGRIFYDHSFRVEMRTKKHVDVAEKIIKNFTIYPGKSKSYFLFFVFINYFYKIFPLFGIFYLCISPDSFLLQQNNYHNILFFLHFCIVFNSFPLIYSLLMTNMAHSFLYSWSLRSFEYISFTCRFESKNNREMKI